ncbi:hypothetical protein M569_09557, partial [Genlisea aurea]
EADLILGGDEGKECTYNKGYMKRQAIFSCLTCTPKGNAGVCTACSLSCHEGHEIVELWTKRNFRCDCGNSKFGDFFCKLFASKDIVNSQNAYNHNFGGTYCTCDLPYPDPNVEEQVEMIQCCVCEDWFHEQHIGLQSSDKIPRDEDGEPLYEDFICPGCAAAFSFLTRYPKIIVAPDEEEKEGVEEDETPRLPSSSPDLEKKGKHCVGSPPPPAEAVASCSSKSCRIVGDIVVENSAVRKPLFLGKSWRDDLCRCERCSDMYGEKGLSFLVDKEDSISEYEVMAKQKRSENIQRQEGNFLNNLGHVERMELLNGIADMKNEIVSFLVRSDPSKAITAADIQQVFQNLANKRKR